MGSYRFPVDMPRMVDFYMAGKLHLDELIAQRLPLEQINQAFDDLRRGELARSVILFEARLAQRPAPLFALWDNRGACAPAPGLATQALPPAGAPQR